MNLNAMLSRAKANETVQIDESWFQGRTAFGGLSAAIALNAAYGILDRNGANKKTVIPSLCSAQITFIGPIFGKIAIEGEILRQGRTAKFVQISILTEKGLGFRAVFVFMSDTGNELKLLDIPAPKTQIAGRSVLNFKNPNAHFINNLELSEASENRDPNRAEILRWLRLKERASIDPMSELLLIGDALPPATMNMGLMGPISSINWFINVLVNQPQTKDGYWLAQSTANFANKGNSSQQMTIWNQNGEPMITGMQSVALF